MVYFSQEGRSDPEQVLPNNLSDTSSIDHDRYLLGVAPMKSDGLSCFSVHNSSTILGNPVPDDRLINVNDEISEYPLLFMHGHISPHA